MKTTIKKIGLLIAILFTILPISAYDFEVDGIYYSVLSLEERTCKVVAGDKQYKGKIKIPSEVIYNDHHLSITSIGNEAFANDKFLTSVTIPNSVITIEERAFFDCSSLTSVTIPNSVTSIEAEVFFDCSSLTSVIIPNSVTSIKEAAFFNCISLTSVTIPNSVTTIEESLFSNCISLTSVTIPNSVTSIKENAFNNCSSLNSVTIPNSVTSIKKAAFSYCSSLISIIIPDSVTFLDSYVFGGCSNLVSIKLSNSIKIIYFGTFNECSSLESLEIPGSISEISQYYDSGTYKYHDTFEYCDNLTYLKLLYSPDFLSVGGEAYEKNSNYVEGDWYDWTKTIKVLYVDRPLKKAIMVPNLEKLELGESISTIQVAEIQKLEKLTIIESHTLVPSSLPELSNVQYINMNVFVPKEALEVYKADPEWSKFQNLQGFSEASVEPVNGEFRKVVTGRYDLSGSPVDDSFKGMVIIRFSDGSTKKIIQK